jgi:hypothetical protein
LTVHCVIPDVQAKPGIDFTYLNNIGKYIVEKKPDVLVCIGDFADMPSLSSYDKGKKSFEGRRYLNDISASHEAMSALLDPLYSYNYNAKKNKKKPYNPKMILTMGNHENRINRAVELQPELEGVLDTEHLKYWEYGWDVHPFLEVVHVDGVAYSHYFTSGTLGRPVTSSRALLTKKHQSCVMGHVQTMALSTDYRADGTPILGLFAGCCYEHDEDYLGPQGNAHFRGIHMLYEVDNGSFYHHAVTLNYLNSKYVKE